MLSTEHQHGWGETDLYNQKSIELYAHNQLVMSSVVENGIAQFIDLPPGIYEVRPLFQW